VTELERALVELGHELEIPTSPDLLRPVLSAIESRPKRRLQRRRWTLVVALAALAALAATLAIPDARSALLRFLHIGGERIELVDALPGVTPDPAELDFELALGRATTLEQARRVAGFDLRELEVAPDKVYLGARGTVWFLYGAPDRVRLLVSQTPLHSVDEELLLKKLAGPETSVEHVDVRGTRGVFLSGEPHLLFLLDPRGEIVEDSARLAHDVLVWEEEGIALRLEGDFTKGEAVAVAESLR